MAYKIFADTNVFLDHLLERTADWESARDIFVLAEQKEITVLTSSLSLINVIYGLKQQKKLTKENIIILITYLLSYTSLSPTNETTFISAIASGFADLEDAIQYHTALSVKNIDYFITANTKGYKKALPQLPVITPKQFIQRIQGLQS
jgi:predicted nucleic acid-binding protein